jgi:lipopolysaccharide export system protein LptA
VLLALAGLAVFFTAYQVYASVLGLGGVDGLTPLPEAYWPDRVGDRGPLPTTAQRRDTKIEKLKQAFGDACPELQRPIKIDMGSRGMVIAVDDFEIQPEPNNNRVKLEPFSVAIFKYHADGGYPEINTIRSKRAFLTLDHPVKSQFDLGRCKIIGGDLQGDVLLRNNRRTPDRSDDLTMYTSGEDGVHYEESRHLIWTENVVQLVDLQTKPKQTTVTAKGMDVFLATEPVNAPKGKAPAKSPSERSGEVERIELRSNVQMDLWSDGGSGFMASSKPEGKPASSPQAGSSAPPSQPHEWAKITITTAGKFTYDLKTNLAQFDIPHRTSRMPEVVEVFREVENSQGNKDHLQCDHLELQFNRKTAPGAAKVVASDPASQNLEIESAHAVGKYLTLTSDAEVLSAYGNDLTYNALKKETVLKGTPNMLALKQGNEIQARELWLGMDTEKDARQTIAIGPGSVSMLDRNADGKMERTIKAYWKDKLVHKKDGAFDSLTLTGGAVFEDPEHSQRLRGDTLKVWLEPTAPAAKSDAADKTESEASRARPHHVEANGRVSADSPELHILEPTENLVIWFQDAPVAAELPAVAPVPGATPLAPLPAPAPAPGTPAYVASKTPTSTTPTGPPAPSNPAAPPEKPKQPLTLSARSVEVHVLRTAARNDLDRVWCEGTVHVHQDPETPEDKGTDIQGDTLQLNHSPEGGILVVNGKLAHVQFNKMAILGPEVNIDQRSNRAWVNGVGAMQMLSETNFDGVKLAQPTELTIQWKDGMNFYGKNAEFRGGVQAAQENSRLLCQEMQVVFDRPISLKEGDKGAPPAKVDRLLCDKSVQIEEITKEAQKLVGYKRLVAPAVDIDNAEKTVHASGPGEVRLFQLGDADQTSSKGSAVTAKPAPGAGKNPSGGSKEVKQEFKITHVRFQGTMWGKNKDPDNRQVTFYGGVDVVHVPSDKPDLVIDIDYPPPGCMYLRCERLDVLAKRLPDGRTNQEMVAQQKVYVKSQEFEGIAEVVKYDEAQDRVIFEGGPNGKAILYHVKTPGGVRDNVAANKITYWRRTGDMKLEGSSGLETH